MLEKKIDFAPDSIWNNEPEWAVKLSEEEKAELRQEFVAKWSESEHEALKENYVDWLADQLLTAREESTGNLKELFNNSIVLTRNSGDEFEEGTIEELLEWHNYEVEMNFFWRGGSYFCKCEFSDGDFELYIVTIDEGKPYFFNMWL